VRNLSIFPLLLAASCATTPEIVELGSWRSNSDERCELKWGEEFVSPTKYAQKLLLRIPRDKAIELRASRDMPYRCIGGLIYDMQRAGLNKIKFVAPK
jgi:hypothetical protein